MNLIAVAASHGKLSEVTHSTIAVRLPTVLTSWLILFKIVGYDDLLTPVKTLISMKKQKIQQNGNVYLKSRRISV